MKGKILVVLLGIIGVLSSVKIAYANEYDSNLRIELIDNITGYKYKNGVLMSRARIPYRYQNNELVYCIEPNNHLGTYTYNSTYDFSISGFSEETKRQMELISHYGFSYPGHNTVNYYLATQELLWLYTDDYVKWMSEYSMDGNLGYQINVEKEKQEILNLVKKHDILPYFDKNSYMVLFGEDITITDKNNILNNYDIISDLDYEISGSSITFHANKFGTHNVKFKTKYIENDKTKLFYTYNNNEQKMARFSLSDIKELDIKISVNEVKLKINKKDNITKDLINDHEAVFKIINVDTGKIDNIKVNGSKTINIKNGKYEIIEEKAPYGYILNKEKINIDINDNTIFSNGIYILDIFNEKPKGKITISKTDEDGNKLNGVEIGLYDKNHKFIKSLITNDKNVFNNLELGTYYIKEINTLNSYVLDTKEYKVDLNYIDDKHEIVNKNIQIINKKIRCNIVYISQSDKKLKDVQINVYDEKDNIVFTGFTNNDGQAIINGLPYGKYYIKQIKVPKGYILNEEEYIFYVNDSTCASIINVHNDKTIMPITTSSFDSCILCAIVLFILGMINYGKENN